MPTRKNRCLFCRKREGHNRSTCPLARGIRADLRSVGERLASLVSWRLKDVREWPEARTLLRLLG